MVKVCTAVLGHSYFFVSQILKFSVVRVFNELYSCPPPLQTPSVSILNLSDSLLSPQLSSSAINCIKCVSLRLGCLYFVCVLGTASRTQCWILVYKYIYVCAPLFVFNVLCTTNDLFEFFLRQFVVISEFITLSGTRAHNTFSLVGVVVVHCEEPLPTTTCCVFWVWWTRARLQ